MSTAWLQSLILIGFVLSLCIHATDFNTIYQNHTMVFISGWPQSGTSFAHQILDSSSLVSSMIKKCEERLGKRCISWNHEGQWILKGSTREAIKSGFVVEMHQLDHLIAESIRQEWGQYWDFRRPVLVEKSPQSFLKIAALASAFHQAKHVRFLIVIKVSYSLKLDQNPYHELNYLCELVLLCCLYQHPVTLNIATPRYAGWKYYRNTEYPVVNDVSSTEINPAQRLENIQHFLDLMMKNESTR